MHTETQTQRNTWFNDGIDDNFILAIIQKYVDEKILYQNVWVCILKQDSFLEIDIVEYCLF